MTEECLLGQHLVPMRETLRLAKAMLQLEFPDYAVSRSALQEEMVKLIKEGKQDEARRRLLDYDFWLRRAAE